MNESFR